VMKFSLKQLLLGLVVASGVACIWPAHAAHAALESDRHAALYDTVYYDPNALECNTGAGGDVTVTVAGKDNAEKIFNYLVDPKRGLTPAQAAGIVGNAKQEHGFQTSDVPGGLGIFQWTSGRRLALIDYAASTGRQPTDITAQLDYLWKELNSTEKRSLDALKKTSTPQEAAISFQDNFERCDPKKCNPQSRIDGAIWAIQTFGNGTAGGSSVSAGGCGGGVNGGCTGANTLKVSGGGTGTDTCYFNQADPTLQPRDYKWQGCGCLPTSTLIIRSTIEKNPSLSSAEVLAGIRSKGGVAGDNCSGVIGGATSYLQSLGYNVDTILPEHGDMTDGILTKVAQALGQGKLVLTHTSKFVNSDYTPESKTDGHFLVIYAVDTQGNFYVANPGAKIDSPVPAGRALSASKIKDWLDMAIAVKK